MAVTWTLRRVATGDERTLAEWGITWCAFRFANCQRDTCDLTFSGQDFLGAGPLQGNEEIAIYRDDGTNNRCFFRGWVREAPRTARGSSESASVQLHGPWEFLERIIYQKKLTFVAHPPLALELDRPHATPATPVEENENWKFFQSRPNWTSVKEYSATLTLGDMPDGVLDTSKRLRTDEYIADALDYAVACGALIGIGTLAKGIQIPPDRTSNVTVAEVIRRCIRWMPDQFVWFDYDASPAVINISDKSARARQDVALSDVVGEVSLRPRYDLQIPGVTIEYVWKHWAGESVEYFSHYKDQAGTGPEAPGAIIAACELAGKRYTDAFGTVSPYEERPIGVAARVFEAWGVLRHSGRLVLVEEDAGATRWLLRSINLPDVPGWAALGAEVQEEEVSVFDGRTAITLGPPPFLGPGDLLEMSKFWGKTPPPAPGGGNGGGGGTDEAPEPTNNSYGGGVDGSYGDEPPEGETGPVEVPGATRYWEGEKIQSILGPTIPAQWEGNIIKNFPPPYYFSGGVPAPVMYEHTGSKLPYSAWTVEAGPWYSGGNMGIAGNWQSWKCYSEFDWTSLAETPGAVVAEIRLRYKNAAGATVEETKWKDLSMYKGTLWVFELKAPYGSIAPLETNRAFGKPDYTGHGSAGVAGIYYFKDGWFSNRDPGGGSWPGV